MFYKRGTHFKRCPFLFSMLARTFSSSFFMRCAICVHSLSHFFDCSHFYSVNFACGQQNAVRHFVMHTHSPNVIFLCGTIQIFSVMTPKRPKRPTFFLKVVCCEKQILKSLKPQSKTKWSLNRMSSIRRVSAIKIFAESLVQNKQHVKYSAISVQKRIFYE